MKKLKRMYRCIEDLKYGNGKTTGCPTKTLGHDRRAGFTLVELVIVIAIVIILSVISVPIYRGYVDKAKYSEAYALLSTIMSAQKAYYSEYGNFFNVQNGVSPTGYTIYEPTIGIDARGNKYFTWFHVNTAGADVKIYFDTAVVAPEDLRKNVNKKWFALSYNVTTGANYYER